MTSACLVLLLFGVLGVFPFFFLLIPIQRDVPIYAGVACFQSSIYSWFFINSLLSYRSQIFKNASQFLNQSQRFSNIIKMVSTSSEKLQGFK